MWLMSGICRKAQCGYFLNLKVIIINHVFFICDNSSIFDGDVMLGRLCNVWVFIQSSGVDALFGC